MRGRQKRGKMRNRRKRRKLLREANVPLTGCLSTPLGYVSYGPRLKMKHTTSFSFYSVSVAPMLCAKMDFWTFIFLTKSLLLIRF